MASNNFKIAYSPEFTILLRSPPAQGSVASSKERGGIRGKRLALSRVTAIGCVRALVEHRLFDRAVDCLLVANLAVSTMRTSHGRDEDGRPDTPMQGFAVCFCLLYAVELALRAVARGGLGLRGAASLRGRPRRASSASRRAPRRAVFLRVRGVKRPEDPNAGTSSARRPRPPSTGP